MTLEVFQDAYGAFGTNYIEMILYKEYSEPIKDVLEKKRGAVLKLVMRQQLDNEETLVEITYSIMTEQLSHIVHYIRQYDFKIEGFLNNRIYHVSLADILYIDVVDRRTFLYTNKDIYECRKNILALEKTFMQTPLVRIGKGQLLNISYLICVKPYPNHRLLAELSNGEKLVVSRKYISDLYDKIRGSRDE